MALNLLSSIEFQIALLLLVALFGYLFAIRLNQSPVIGQILLGLLIGPSFFKLITYTDFVQHLAHLGAIILLFVVGLEFRSKDIFNIRYGLIALVGVIVPWIGGFLTTTSFGYSFENAVFVGTALTATSIAITANVLKEMGKLQSEAARAIIGAAVIDDVLGLLALSLSKEFVHGSFSWDLVILPVIKAVLFLGIGIYVGQKILRPGIERLDQSTLSSRHTELVFIVVITIAFIYAMLAEMLHLSAIVGSFLAGISLEGVVIRKAKSYKEGAEYLNIIFASIFFVSLGILVDMRVITAGVFSFMMILTIVAILTKWIGCFIPAKMQGMSTRDAAVVGFGMSPRGEVAMIVGLIALGQNLVTQEIYTAIIFMSLLTTIGTPVVLRLLYKNRAN